AERPHVRSLRPEVPEALDALVFGLMQIEPLARPASAAAVREALLAIRAKLLPKPRRWPALVAVAALGALGLYGWVGRAPPPVEPGPPLVVNTRDPVAEAEAAKRQAEAEAARREAEEKARAERKLLAERG